MADEEEFAEFVAVTLPGLLRFGHVLTGNAVAAEPAGGSVTAEDHACRVDDRDAMWRALQEFPPRQRAVIVLRYYEDLTEAEIAAVMRGYASATALIEVRPDGQSRVIWQS